MLLFRFNAGNKVSQFNATPPISKLVNSVSSLLFKNNFMKLYEKEFAEISTGREVVNGLFMTGKFSV